jgi:hypothetical protein
MTSVLIRHEEWAAITLAGFDEDIWSARVWLMPPAVAKMFRTQHLVQVIIAGI